MSTRTQPAEADTHDADAASRPDVRAMVGDLASASGDALGHVRDAAADVTGTLADRAPQALSLSQETLDQIGAYLKASSSDTIVLGTVYSVGLWTGLALARSPRWVMLLAMLPVLVLGGTLLSRRTPGTAKTRS